MQAGIEYQTRVSAYGLVTSGQRILLCRLSERSIAHQGEWTLPGGGLHFGETPEQAMQREVYEETGLSVKAAGIAGVDSLLVELETLKHHGIRLIYHTNYLGGILCFEQEGSTDRCEWFSRDEALALPLVALARVGIELALK